MKILVPVDFNLTSFSAFYYATQLAEKLNAKLTIFYVETGSFNLDDEANFNSIFDKSNKIINKLKHFTDEYPKEIGIKMNDIDIKYDMRFGIPGFTITDYAHDRGFDLIIMGTRDKHGIFDRILGTASSIAIKTARCPIMLIHKSTKYNDPQKIAFAFDKHGDIEDSISSFKKLNNNIMAHTDFIHVNKKDNLEEPKDEIIEELFESNGLNFSFVIKAIDGKDINNTILDYCMFESIDILAFIHRKEGVFDTILNKSISVKMAQKIHLPVIIFNENKHD